MLRRPSKLCASWGWSRVLTAIAITFSALLAVTTTAVAHANTNTNYTLFEVDPVRPVAVLPQSSMVAVVNVPDDYLEIFQPQGASDLAHCASIKVGMRPVAVAVVEESANRAELWVVNHISDSISVVAFNPSNCAGHVSRTLHSGDEPRDIVVANTPTGKRVLVTTAHRGQHHPDPVAKQGTDLTLPANQKAAQGRPRGLADVLIYDPSQPNMAPQVVNMFTDTPRALALAPPNASGFHEQVYAAGFHTGNRTSIIAGETARAVGVEHLAELLHHGDVAVAPDGNLTVPVPGSVKMKGGQPAIVGRGRCVPDPRPERMRRHSLQLCAQTDADHNLLALHPQGYGVTNPGCSCTNADGTLQPVTGVLVKFYDDAAICNANHDPRIGGCWLDADPAQVAQYESEGTPVPPAMEWNDWIKFSLPDEDVFSIALGDGSTPVVAESYTGVGTTLFGMVAHPRTGEIYVANQDANNFTRFEGAGHFAGRTVRGDLTQAQISVLAAGNATQRRLNDHLDDVACCTVPDALRRRTVAFPVALAISNKTNITGHSRANQTLYFAALGSDKVSAIRTNHLQNATASTGAINSHVRSISLSKRRPGHDPIIAGPVGLALDHQTNRLYVLARFTNELVVLDAQGTSLSIQQRLSLHSPEPQSVTAGRSVLYYAGEMSAKGDQSCASCHPYAQFDGLAWNLGDPDQSDVNNPGPFISPPPVGYTADIAKDPNNTNPYLAALPEDFRANKGPMATQALRGLDNHGALHWRGDRVRHVQNEIGAQPNVGPMDEHRGIVEFDVAVEGLVGGDQPLPGEKMEALADFLMQVTYPPNPIRNLDNSLSPEQEAGRAAYFGCQSMSDAQFEKRQCIDTTGRKVNVDRATRKCECYGNPVRFVMNRLLAVKKIAKALLWLRVQLPASVDPGGIISTEAIAQVQALKPLARKVARMQRRRLSTLAAPDNIAADSGIAKVYTATQLDDIQAFLAGTDYPNTTGGLLALVQWLKAQSHSDAAIQASVLQLVLEQLNFSGLDAEVIEALRNPATIEARLAQLYGDGNVSRRTLMDAQQPQGEGLNLLRGCKLQVPASACTLRIADSLTTCQSCHVLDPKANAKEGVAAPGFFGTSGEFAFSNIPQVFKVPHLRNMYAKVGRSGHPHDPDMFVPESVLGARAGGFFSRKTPNVGPAVRGFGFSHDGSADTLHRFLGLLDFLKRPAEALGVNDVRGNPDAFDAFVPANPNACLASVAAGAGDFFGLLGHSPETVLPLVTAAIAGDETASAQVVGMVLTSPAPTTDMRWGAIARSAGEAAQTGQPVTEKLAAPIVEAVAASLLCPNVPDPDLLPLCFQLGSTLEWGAADGVCYPHGLTERQAAESFVLAFDSNLKPMVGQQITVPAGTRQHGGLERMIKAAAAKHCDIGAVSGESGAVMQQPNGTQPWYSKLKQDNGRYTKLMYLMRDATKPVTFTCYPPRKGMREAKRSVLDRDGDGVRNAADATPSGA